MSSEKISCQYCGDFKSLDLLKEHEEMCGARTENCIYCNKLITRKNMKKHLEDCQKQFQNNNDLKHLTSSDLYKMDEDEQIANIVKELENNSQIKKIISKRVTKTKKRTREMTKINTLNSTINKNGISKAGTELGKINNLRYLHQNHVFNGFSTMSLSINKDVSYSELEFMSGGKVDEDDIPDNYTKKKIRKIRKKRASSIEESIVNKLYSPFLKKTSYLRQLNKNMK